MRTIRTKVYKFDELSNEAKEVAIEKLWDINVDYEWWESIYEDAKNIGLELTDFEFDSASFVRNVEGQFILSASEVAANIFRDHGENCETYVTANGFMHEFTPIFSQYVETEEGEDELIKIETDFLNELLNDYKNLLQTEYEYQTSRKAIVETIEVNEYEFYANGKLI
jgi:hypothetical protein